MIELKDVVSGATAGIVVSLVLALYTYFGNWIAQRRRTAKNTDSWKQIIEQRLDGIESQLARNNDLST